MHSLALPWMPRMGRGWQEIYLIGPSLDFTYLRRSEWICLAYFAYIPILSFIINVPASRRLRLLALNGATASGILLLPAAMAFAPRLFISVVRDWLPAPLILLAYHEAGLLTLPRRDQFFEKAFQRLDELLFRLPLLRVLHSNCTLPDWVDAVPEFSY